MAVSDPFFEHQRAVPAFDAGLRAYMLRIYNYMALALIVTGGVAFYAAHSEPLLSSMYVIQNHLVVGMKPMAWVVVLAPLALVFFLSFGLRGMSLAAAQLSYWVYASLVGLSLSLIFLAYTDTSIARVFFITAGTFAGMNIIGYSARKDLTGLGSFMMMGLIGLIIASFANLFFKSSGMQFGLSVVGVIVFVGLTAFDTQKLKALYYDVADDHEWEGKVAIMGALTLYLDFINIFMSLLRLMGEDRNR